MGLDCRRGQDSSRCMTSGEGRAGGCTPYPKKSLLGKHWEQGVKAIPACEIKGEESGCGIGWC